MSPYLPLLSESLPLFPSDNSGHGWAVIMKIVIREDSFNKCYSILFSKCRMESQEKSHVCWERLANEVF